MELKENVVDTKTVARPWGKYLKRAALLMLIVAVLLRMALPLALPSLLQRFAGQQGLQVNYSKLDLSVLTGSLELWDVSVRPLADVDSEPETLPERLGRLEFLTVDVDVSALFGGTLRAHRVEIDGLDVYARRESLETGWTWETLLPGESEGVTSEPELESEPNEAQPTASVDPFDWSLGFEVSAVRLQHVQLHIEDHAMQPAFTSDLELNVRLSHLGLQEEPARLEVFAHSLEFLDGFSVEGSLLANGPDLDVVCQVNMRGLRPRSLRAYLQPFGVVPLARNIDCDLKLELATRAANEEATALDVQALVSDVQWLADGQELMALDEITLSVPHFSRAGVRTEIARIRGIRGRARRTASGALAIAGFRLDGSPATGGNASSSDSEESAASSRAFELHIPKLELSEVALHWDDEVFVPNPSLDLELSSLTIEPLQRAAGVASPPMHIELSMSAPGVVESMQLQGDVQVFADVQTVDLQMAMAGFKPERAAAYLNAAGLRSNFEAGAGSAQVHVSTHLDSQGVRHLEASMQEVSLVDGETLFAVQAIELKGLALDGEKSSTRIEELSVTGTRLKVSRDAEGLWHCLGLVVDPEGARTQSARVARQTPSVSDSDPAPGALDPVDPVDVDEPARFELVRLALTDTNIEVLDESLTPAVHQVFDDLGLILTDLTLGGEVGQEPATPANLELWFRAQGLAQRLALAGTLASRPGPLDLQVDLNLTGQGLELTALEPWLEPAGIESLWQAAELNLKIDAHVQAIDSGTHLALGLSNLDFTNQGESWLALAELSVPSVVLADSGITIQPIRIAGPELLLRRDSEGTLEALGLRLHPRAPTPEPEAGPQAPAEPSPGGGSSLSLELAALDIEGVQVRWQDEFVQPQVDTALRMGLALKDLKLGDSILDPMTLQATVAVDDNLERLQIEGEFWLEPEDLRLQMSVAMQGLRKGSLSAYMPPNVAMELADGRLSWHVEMRYVESAAGGHSLDFEAVDLVFKDGEAGTDLLSLPRLALNVPIIDPAGHRFDIQEVALEGLTLPVRIDGQGVLHGFGFAVSPAAPVPPADAQSAAAQPGPADGVQDQALTPGGSDHVAVSKAQDRVLPLVTLHFLDVGISSFTFVDERGGVPLDFGLHLTQDEPQTLLAPEAANLPALKFKIEGAARPIVDSIAVDLEFTPYATEPAFDVQALISGIHGNQVTRVLPALAESLDGSAWTAGQLEGHVQGQLQMRRRGPLDFDLANGFGAQLVVDGVAVRATADGPALLGFEELTASVASIRPETGDVHVKRVEWVQPFGSAWMDEEGLHAAGWVLKMPQASTPEPGDGPEEAEVQVASTTPEATPEAEAELAPETDPEQDEQPLAEAAPAAPAPTSPEIRVDEVLISGGTFLFEDRTVEPAFVFPIDDVDFQLKRFSTRTLEEDRPFRFRLALYGGEVELPERTGGGNLIGGILGSVAALAGGNEFEPEQRPIFDELTLRGKMSVGPMPKGWVQLRLRGFELPAVSGLASEAGVTIGDGLLGESTMLHFDGKGGLRISSQTNFTYLSLSEPPGGPISSYLKLPAPLDSVLFVLKDEDGDHAIPLHLTMDEGGASLGTILGAVTKSLGLLIGEALASAPMRVVGGLVDLAGLGAEPIELTGDEWVQVPYGAGVVQASETLEAQAAPLLDLLRRDPSLYLTVVHELGSQDVKQAKQLANPSREESLDLAAFYRRRRGELLHERDDAAALVREAYAMGKTSQVQTATASLKLLDSELGRTESSLDRVLDRTRDQSDRAQLRRTKSAALEVSRRRLSRVKALLRAAKIPSIGTRLDVRRPRFSKVQEQTQGSIRIAVARRR